MSQRVYTENEISEAIRDYMNHYNVTDDTRVDVCRRYNPDGEVVGFRLSLDVDGRSRGCDERYGEW